MPLVVPKTDEPSVDWRLKLLGKKLTESGGDVSTFSVKDLPDSHRIILPGMFTSMDHNPERRPSPMDSTHLPSAKLALTSALFSRLTIIVDENNVVTEVNYS
ncbi:hypothetical protein KEM54_002536 [Ascosphaera aggregata]|nr:hypothetical protein KEM54_002536 [Ascosphaera aggregata]